MSEVLADNIRRAAHGRHRCSLCGDRIAQGERYRDARLADSGTAWTWREHLRCGDFLREAMDPWDYQNGYDAGTFHDYVRDSDFAEIARKHGLVNL